MHYLEITLHKALHERIPDMKQRMHNMCMDFLLDEEKAVVKMLTAEAVIKSGSALSFAAHLCDEGIRGSVKACTTRLMDTEPDHLHPTKSDAEILEARAKQAEDPLTKAKLEELRPSLKEL